MREKALAFYREGYNCSQSILKAAEALYAVPMPEQSVDMCCCVNMGLGTGGLCCALIGSVMLFGLMFDEDEAKKLRIELMDMFYQQYGSLNCCLLSANGTNTTACEKIIADAAGMTQQIIEESRRQA
ncbi:MAG: C-GCAxxG-C-C family protein [Clostridiales bacterium]|jgi:C_GCAxxG_C_C family probable redox protein|nr:C-GCAxxG-C-C family protein [Clostridiales bacterium]